MCSQQLCEKYLQLLFTVLEKSADMAVRANTIVAAGDLAFRYPTMNTSVTSATCHQISVTLNTVRKTGSNHSEVYITMVGYSNTIPKGKTRNGLTGNLQTKKKTQS